MMWYMQCVNVRGDSTRHRYTSFLWIWCSWSADWFHQYLEGFPKIVINRVRVDFVKVQGSFWFCQSLEGFHKIGVSRVRIDLVKVLGLFCKINIHKVWVFFLQNYHPWTAGRFYQSSKKFMQPSIECVPISLKFRSIL